MEIKIPFYNILNMFLTGLIFISGCIILFPEFTLSVLKNEIVKSLGTGPEIVITVCVFAVAYEVGLLINRLGSVVIEASLKRMELIPFKDDYVLYNEKKKQYPILNTLSREYALSRTSVALFLVLFALSLTVSNCKFGVICLVIVLINFLSLRKHAHKIVSLLSSAE